MKTLRGLLQQMQQKRPLYAQLLFAVLAFSMMGVLSYIFMSDIVHTHLLRNTKNALDFGQAQIEHSTLGLRIALGSVSRTARSMIMRGDDAEKLRNYLTEISDYVRSKGGDSSGFSDFYGYFETLPGGPAFINAVGWNPQDTYVPTERPWYREAIAAKGEITEMQSYPDVFSKETVLAYAICIFDDAGRRLGVVGLRTNLTIFGKNILGTALAEGSFGILLNRDLLVLAHPNQEFVGGPFRAVAPTVARFEDELRNGMEVFGRDVVDYRGEPSVAFFRKLSDGWFMGIIAPKAPYYQSVAYTALILLGLGLLFAAMLSYVLIRIDAAKTKADEESRQKTHFLANMSHEMRTPLNAIIGFSELSLSALESGNPTGEAHANLEKIYNAGMTLLSTVNDILDISKIEAGRLELHSAEYDIPSLLNDAITQSILHIDEKPIEFRLNIDKNLPTRLYGDELRVKQICNNLLSNAFKYTKEGTVELRVRCKRQGDAVWMTIRVQDSGIGIRRTEMHRVFSDYAQMGMEANRKITGTGLGLSITKRLAEMMGGSVSVKSEYGKGSVFTVHLLQKFVTEVVIGQDVCNSLQNFRYSDQKRLQGAHVARIRLPYARVLVVDDMLTNLDVAKGMMRPYGMHIDCVTGGRQAVEAVRDETVRYNAIFMDHMMPEMDGIEATRIIREEIGSEYARTIPIIALTANALVGNEAMFLSRGFQAFLPKPIEVARLDAIIRQWVRDKELEVSLPGQGFQMDGELIPNTCSGRDRRVADRRSESDLWIFTKKIDGLDMLKGLERLGGDKAAFLQVLRSYVVNIPPLLEALKGVAKENLSNYATVVHGIKGASRGICADSLGDGAAALEDAARAGNIDFVLANNAAFIEAVETLINGMDDLLRQADTMKPKKDQPDKDVLSRLLTACEGYDMDGVDAAMAELESSEYEFDKGLAPWLRENADQMNFLQIQDKLRFYCKIA